MMNLIMDQVITYLVGTLLSTLVASCCVGGVFWHKLNVNKLQNERMDELLKLIKSNEELLHVMSCHQLQISCYRAVEKGCITFDEKQEIKRLYDQYKAKKWNGPGEIAYQAMDKLPVQDICD